MTTKLNKHKKHNAHEGRTYCRAESVLAGNSVYFYTFFFILSVIVCSKHLLGQRVWSYPAYAVNYSLTTSSTLTTHYFGHQSTFHTLKMM